MSRAASIWIIALLIFPVGHVEQTMIELNKHPKISYYWICCGEEHKEKSLNEARIKLEVHEKLCHNGKTIGTFGKEIS